MTEPNVKRGPSWLLTSVLGVIMVLAFLVVVVPNYVNVPDATLRAEQMKHACVSNLEQLQAGKIQWAEDNQKKTNDTPNDADLFGSDKYLREKPTCPGDGTYIIGAVDEKPRCSIPGHTI